MEEGSKLEKYEKPTIWSNPIGVQNCLVEALKFDSKETKLAMRRLAYICLHDPESWAKEIGDPKRFLDAMKEQGVEL